MAELRNFGNEWANDWYIGSSAVSKGCQTRVRDRRDGFGRTTRVRLTEFVSHEV
jgi:hypothetical protein